MSPLTGVTEMRSATDPRSIRSGLVGYVPGGWDTFHVGHVLLLTRARALCDHLVAGVVTDKALTSMKGRPPLIPFAERFEIVQSMAMVDEVVADRSADKRQIWQQLSFDLLIKGNDWEGTSKGARLENDMATVGARVIYLPYTERTSSTRLRQLLAG